MNKNWKKINPAAILVLILILFGIGSLCFSGALQGKSIYNYASWVIVALIIIIGAIFIFLVAKGKITQSEPDYRTLFMVGIIFLPMGLGRENRIFLLLSFAFITIGLINKKKWKKELKFGDLPSGKKKFKIVILTVLAAAVIASLIAWYINV